MNQLDMIFDMLKSMHKRQEDDSKALIRMEADLKYHIKRTDLLEESLNTKISHPNYRRLSIIIGLIATAIGIAATLKVL